MIELTVPAEEGIAAAQIRKESRYRGLVDEIHALNTWKAFLLTLEIGARGVNPLSARRSLIRLGLTPRESTKLLGSLSVVAARCSFAIFLHHRDVAWQKPDAVVVRQRTIVVSSPDVNHVDPVPSNLEILQAHGIVSLFHFTDSSNLVSIRKHGLLSASALQDQLINAKMNSDEASRKLDVRLGLENYVRLSFNASNPMKFVATKHKRIGDVVTLKINLGVVLRPGVLYCDCNATRKEAVKSESPIVVHFDVVRAISQFEVPLKERRFYQAEVLVPSPIPPEFIIFPVKTQCVKPPPGALEMGKILSPDVVESALSSGPPPPAPSALSSAPPSSPAPLGLSRKAASPASVPSSLALGTASPAPFKWSENLDPSFERRVDRSRPRPRHSRELQVIKGTWSWGCVCGEKTCPFRVVASPAEQEKETLPPAKFFLCGFTISGKWFCDCGRRDCGPAKNEILMTGSSSFGRTGATPIRLQHKVNLEPSITIINQKEESK